MGGLIAFVVFLIVAFLLLWVWPTINANSIGRSKGQENAWLWGLALGWIGVMIVSSAPTPQPVAITVTAGYTPPPTKACPDCAETVKSAAKVCRFCGHHF